MLQPTSLLDFALENTRNKILCGEYPEGFKLTPKAVADDLGISQTPVKAAFNQLVTEHLLQKLPRRGYQVSSFSLKFLRNIIDARKLIEGYVADHAVDAVDQHPEIMEDLQKVLNDMANNSGTFLENPNIWEKHFHVKIAELAGNDFLLETYKQLWNITCAYYTRTLSTWPLSNMKKSLSEHTEMYRCLQLKDAKRLKETFREHIYNMECRMGLFSHDTL